MFKWNVVLTQTLTNIFLKLILSRHIPIYINSEQQKYYVQSSSTIGTPIKFF